MLRKRLKLFWLTLRLGWKQRNETLARWQREEAEGTERALAEDKEKAELARAAEAIECVNRLAAWKGPVGHA